MNNKRMKIQEICLDAMFLALIILMTFTPIGFIAIPPVSATLIHIPVLIGAYLFGKNKGLVYGIFFGVMSMIKAYQSPTSILDPFFQNPLISILPRALFGFLSGWVFEILRMHIHNSKKEKTLSIITSFVMTIVHSLLVFGALYLFYHSDMEQIAGDANYASYWLFVGLILLTQSSFEALLAALIVPLVSFPIDRYALKGLLVNRISSRRQKKMELQNTKVKDDEPLTVIVDFAKDEQEKEISLKIKKDE